MKRPIQYASTINDVLNAFQPRPLDGDELNTFYYNDTMQVRMGDENSSPIDDIFDSCKTPLEGNVFLLMGHRGCGKSTELNKMSQRLEAEGYPVFTIPCAADMDILNSDCSDLLILMGDALLHLADRVGCTLPEELTRTLADFWDEKSIATTILDDRDTNAQAGLSVQTPSLLQKLLSISASVKSTLRFGEERRTIYRARVTRRLSRWMAAMNELADLISEKLDWQRQPILIFEDLDKLNAANAWALFGDNATTLSAPAFPVIYTFPIALSYDTKFHDSTAVFQIKNFPMIKVERLEGGRCEEGFAAITQIVERRIDPRLFGENALDFAIEKTGGSLRELFRVIITAATRARRRKSSVIECEDIQRALVELKSMLTRMIDDSYYDFLVGIVKGDRIATKTGKSEKSKDEEAKKLLLKMLQAGTVLEYNGKRWHNVHPLVTDFLRELGMLS